MRGSAPGPDDRSSRPCTAASAPATTPSTTSTATSTASVLRRRRQHDLRRTMISLARADGASKDILETVTHGARGDIMDSYTTLPWANVCAEVAKLRVQIFEGKVVGLPRLAVVGGEAEGMTRE
jgi:hypothetical protein